MRTKTEEFITLRTSSQTQKQRHTDSNKKENKVRKESRKQDKKAYKLQQKRVSGEPTSLGVWPC